MDCHRGQARAGSRGREGPARPLSWPAGRLGQGCWGKACLVDDYMRQGLDQQRPGWRREYEDYSYKKVTAIYTEIYRCICVYRCKRASLCAPIQRLEFFFWSCRRPGPDASQVSSSQIQILQCRIRKIKCFDAICLPLVTPRDGGGRDFEMTVAGRLGISVWKAV